MASSTQETPHDSSRAPPTWTYPTRFCRICREDVAPTVTMYPPGLPFYLQKPVVEYVNADEYGRLIKPCMCRGGMRYIHELCLLRSRTENNRVGSLWKCHECGHKFNFQKLAIQRWLGSKYSASVLTVVVMLAIMFSLGFVADPIINLYADPYDTLIRGGTAWTEVKVRSPVAKTATWSQHFFKGLISMGLVGFLKTLVLNPIHWWNYRQGGFVSSRTTSTTGRDRAVNISWVAVVIGVSSAFYFFYQWVQTLVQRTLQRVGNNIVNTQLSGDDDDLKPPSGWKPESSTAGQAESVDATGGETTSGIDQSSNPSATIRQRTTEQAGSSKKDDDQSSTRTEDPDRHLAGSWIDDEENESTSAEASTTIDPISQGWSFANLN